MTLRIPAQERSLLRARAQFGIGLDREHPTLLDGGRTVPAAAALDSPPAQAMLAAVSRAAAHVTGAGGLHVVAEQDIRRYGLVGSLTLTWDGGPQVEDVAAALCIRRSMADLPLLPAWLGLRRADTFDVRWQLPY